MNYPQLSGFISQTVSCPPAAIRGQKSLAGLISLRKCTGNLSIILSLKHPLFFLMAPGQLMSFASLAISV